MAEEKRWMKTLGGGGGGLAGSCHIDDILEFRIYSHLSAFRGLNKSLFITTCTHEEKNYK